jgi:hypothetical protein
MVHAHDGACKTRNAACVILADSAPWANWANVAHIAVPARAVGLVRVRLLPLSIAPAADGGFPDVRVIDETDREIPFALDPERRESTSRDVPLLDAGFVVGRGTQAVLDLGTAGDLVDTIDLHTDPSRLGTYVEAVDIDASGDRATWRLARPGAIVYRVAEDGGRGSQRVAIPPTRSRWLRVRIRDAHRAFPLIGASVAREPSRDAIAPIHLAPTYALDRSKHDERWTFAAPVALRTASVTFAGARGTFSRDASIETSDDRTTWDSLGSGHIEHFADGSGSESLAFPERTAKFVRVSVSDGNDVPLAGATPQLAAVPHDVIFEASPMHTYRLLSKNLGATAPTYDLAARLAHEAWTATAAAAEPTRAFVGYVGPADDRTLTQRYPWLLSVVIGVVALMLALFALATLRKAGAADATDVPEPRN